MRIIRQTFLYKKLRASVSQFLMIMGLAGLILAFVPSASYAGCGCTGCIPGDVPSAKSSVQSDHSQGTQALIQFITNAFDDHKDWLVTTFWEQNVAPAMFSMTEQLTAVAMNQVAVTGMFFDAKQQLETQRVIQELQNEAHKDYQPSEDFCWFGTNVRSMAASEQIGRHNTLVLNARQMSRHMGQAGISGADARDNDKLNRWKAFIATYCDPKDNNWDSAVTSSGLELACGATGGGNTDRINIDIDYARLIEEPRTLNVNFTDGSDPSTLTPSEVDEQDVMALGNNLYGHDVLSRGLNPNYLANRQYQHLYMALRSVAAKRSVAENSFNAIVGLKSAGTADVTASPGSPPENTAKFLGAVLKELGVPDGEIYQLVGESPSYYAQLEIMAKKIYQNPDFFSNLYDKPANVKRKGVALKAIELMLDRAIYESQLRQEMATSVLLSSRLRSNFRSVNKELSGG